MLKNIYQVEISGKRYQARVIDGQVTQLHRLMPKVILQGGEWITVYDDFRSISKNAKGRAELDTAILKEIAS